MWTLVLARVIYVAAAGARDQFNDLFFATTYLFYSFDFLHVY